MLTKLITLLIGFYTLGGQSSPLVDLSTIAPLPDISTSGLILEPSTTSPEISKGAPSQRIAQGLTTGLQSQSTPYLEHSTEARSHTEQLDITTQVSTLQDANTRGSDLASDATVPRDENIRPETSTSYYENSVTDDDDNTTSEYGKGNLTLSNMDERAHWFAVTSFKELRDTRTAEEVVKEVAEEQFAKGKSVITIINYSGDKMSLQCKSSETDLGSRMLPDQYGFSFSFDPVDSEHFWCYAWWKDNYKEFTVYGKSQPKEVNTIWELYGYGLYFQDFKKFDWGKHPIQKTRVKI